mgnify:CR=1 FL=1
MKISVAPSLFDRIPGLCIGIVAVRAADNAAANMEAEAFRRRCCTEANLLLKMDPALAEKELEDAITASGMELLPGYTCKWRPLPEEIKAAEKFGYEFAEKIAASSK